MTEQKTNKKVRFYINTTIDIKENIESTLADANIEKHNFLSDLLLYAGQDACLLSFLIDYQIQQKMGRRKFTESDIDKLTGDEAKRIVFLENLINRLSQEKYRVAKSGLPTLDISEKMHAASQEITQIKNKVWER